MIFMNFRGTFVAANIQEIECSPNVLCQLESGYREIYMTVGRIESTWDIEGLFGLCQDALDVLFNRGCRNYITELHYSHLPHRPICQGTASRCTDSIPPLSLVR